MAITEKFHKISLLKAGALTGTAKSLTTDLTTTLTDYSFGANNDLWGATLSVAEVNDSEFGFGVSFIGAGASGANYTSKYLCGKNFGFAIPAGSTINGVVATVRVNYLKPSGHSWYYAYVDSLSCTVYYSAAAAGPALLKTVNGLAKASVKTRNGLAIASIKSWDGLA